MPKYFLWDPWAKGWMPLSRMAYVASMRTLEQEGKSGRGLVCDDESVVQETPKQTYVLGFEVPPTQGSLAYVSLIETETNKVVYQTSFICGNGHSYDNARRRVDEWCERHNAKIVE